MHRVGNKYLGRSKACVVDNRDPKKRGRILINHPQLGETAWIPYLKSPGQFDVPSIGDVVYIEAESGYYEYPVAWGNVVKGLDEAPDIPEVFQREIPTNRGLYTPGGHTLELDDGIMEPTQEVSDSSPTTNSRGIRFTTTAGNKIHIAEDEVNGQQFILLETPLGDKIKLDYKLGKITITDTVNIVEVDKIAQTITSTNGQGKIFRLDNKQILGAGTEPVVLGDTLFTMLDDFLSSIISGILPGSPGQNAASLLAIKDSASTLQGVLATFKSPNSTTD